MARKSKKKSGNVRLSDLTDQEVVSIWEDAGCNAGNVATTLGVHRSTVIRRLNKIGIDGTGEEEVARRKSVGRAATMLAKISTSEGTPAFQQGRAECLREMSAIARLEACIGHADSILVAINDDIERQNGKYKPYQIDHVMKVIREIRGLTESAFTIKTKLYDKVAMDAFVEAVIRLLEEETPDVQRRLFVKLSRLGYEGQVGDRDAAKDPGDQGGCG